MADCFADLKANLTDDEGALAYVADSTMWLKGKTAGFDNSQLWEWLADPDAKSTIATFIDQFIEAQKTPGLGKSAKDNLGRQRKRFTVIQNLQTLLTEGPSLDADTIDELWDFVVTNGSKKTFFPKDFPFQTDEEFLAKGAEFVQALKTPQLVTQIPAQTLPGGSVTVSVAQVQEAIDAVSSHGQNHVKKALASLGDDHPLSELDYHAVTELFHGGPKPKGVTTKQSVIDWLESQKDAATPGVPEIPTAPLKPNVVISSPTPDVVPDIPTTPKAPIVPDVPEPPKPDIPVKIGPETPKTPPEPVFTTSQVQIEVTDGTHPKLFLQDQDGGQWMFKWFSRSGEEFRSDVEHYAHEAGQLFGFDMADSRLIDWGGHYGQVQKLWDGSDLTGVSLRDLSADQWDQLAQHHLLDWLLDNDDSHAANIFQLAHDGSIVGIDKGRAFAHFGTGRHQLKLGSMSRQNHVVYEDLYRLLHSTSAGRDKLDEIYRSVMARAKAMEAVDDDAYREVLEKLLAGRTNYSTTSAANRDQLIGQIIDRKNSLADDFDRFYDQVYQRAGLAKPKLREVDVRDPLPEVRRAGGPPKTAKAKAWSGYSDDYFEAVIQSRAHGQATFWGGKDAAKIRNQQEFLWWERDRSVSSGVRLRGEMKLRADGDADMMQFLARYTDTSAPTTGAVRTPLDEVWDHDKRFGEMVEAAKTINHHVNDGAYNPNRIATLPDIRRELEDLRSRAFTDKSDEWRAALHEQIRGYIGDLDVLEEAMRTQTALPYHINKRIVEVVHPKSSAVPPARYTVRRLDEIPHDARSATMGSYDSDEGLADVVGNGDKSHGRMFEIEVSDNVTVTYVPYGTNLDTYRNNDIIMSAQGRLRFTVKEYTGPDDLKVWRKFLDDAGFTLSPAQDTDLELMYWRMFYETANQFKTSPKWRAALRERDAWRKRDPDPTPEEEIAFLRGNLVDAGVLDSSQVRAVAADRKWAPRYHRQDVFNPDAENGRAWWERPDFDVDAVDRELTHWPSSLWTARDGTTINEALRSGGMLSTEERLRKLHKVSTPPGKTMSAADDQLSGGANYVFTRLNIHPNGGHEVWYNPSVVGRMSSYAFGGDSYGRVKGRESESFNFFDWLSNFGSGNELMPRDVVTLLDEIELVVFPTASERDSFLKWIRSSGVTRIRGVPVEDRFITRRSDVEGALRKVQEAWRRRRGR
jgi:hypothetical protein